MGGLLLSACAPGDRADKVLQNYQWRMSNVFELEEADLASAVSGLQPRFPLRRSLIQAIPPLNINLLEFLQLSRCELQRLLGQRNSSLGLVMPVSQRFLYELSFLELAQICIIELERLSRLQPVNDEDARLSLVRLLQAAVTHKQQWLAASYWNALWGSDEFQLLFSTATPMPRVSGLQLQPVALEEALEWLTAGSSFWQQQPRDARNRQLEQALAVVGSEKYLGQLRLAMVTISRVLASTTDAVAGAQQRRSICLQHTLSPRGTIMQRVFLRYYIGEVQPLISLVHQRVSSLRPLLSRALQVAEQLPAGQPPASLEDYWQRVWADRADSEWGQYSRAVADHTRMWQRLLKQCGLQPGASPDAEQAFWPAET